MAARYPGRPPASPAGQAPDNRLQEPLSHQLARDHAGDWQTVVQTWHDSPAGQALMAAVDRRVAAGVVVYPARVLWALQLTPLARTRVVVLGQDPYHGPGQAQGLAFSVHPGVPLPPSLRNIFKELQRDLGLAPPQHGCLQAWAEQGVLLLNRTLTVEDGQAGSHAGLGWQGLTDALVAAAAADAQPKVFLLWGAHAQQQAPLIQASGQGRHAVLRANHPSPLAARRPPLPFIGCGHFGQARDWLQQAGRGVIDWALA